MAARLLGLAMLVACSPGAPVQAASTLAATVPAEATRAEATRAEAGLPDWMGRPYEYLIVEQDLRTVLEEFGKNVGARVMLSPAVQGRVKGNMPRASARAFLDAVARAYGLDWYHDGFVLHVSASAESKTRSLDLHDLSFDAAMEGLKRAGLHDPRFTIRPGPSPSLVTVSGPPRFVEGVAEAVTSLAKTKAAVPAVSVMHVYRGASAVEKLTFP